MATVAGNAHINNLYVTDVYSFAGTTHVMKTTQISPGFGGFGQQAAPFHTHNGIDSPLLSFIGLSDAPSSYAGSAGELLEVNSTATGVTFVFNAQAFKYLTYRAVGSGTTLSTGTKIGGDWVVPFTGTVTAVGATVDTAGTTGTMQVNILKNGTTILSTKITLDSAEKTSRTAATPPVVSVPGAVTGDIFTFNVDTVQTTPATGLTIFMNFTQTGI